MIKTINEIEEEYDLELDRIIKTIKKQHSKRVLIQLPDGMKPYSTVIVNYLENKLPKTQFYIWLGSCFGACDTPQVSGFDLVIQFGHSAWKN